MKVVVLGLSITSSWGNGHATTYRALLRELALRGHEVLFLERDVPWYADNRDLTALAGVEIALYDDLADLRRRHAGDVAGADAVIVGSYVPQGVQVGEWVLATARGAVAFYDIDTPVTLSRLRSADGVDYLSLPLIKRYPLYLSFSGGATLTRLEREFGSPRARALYCSVDADEYLPDPAAEVRWELGYLGTYSADRQPALDRLLVQPASHWPAGRFVVAGPQYPAGLAWPGNVERIEHLAPAEHRRFYTQQRFTLNVTRADMVAAGHSPSVRLFEAAACGTPIISDYWTGLEDFFEIGTELLVARSTVEMLRILREFDLEEMRRVGAAGRRRVLARHTAAHRAAELETHLHELMGTRRERTHLSPLLSTLASKRMLASTPS